LPLWPAAAHTGAIQREQLRLHLWPGTGAFTYYEDDGLTRAYMRGDYRLTRFTWRAGGAGATLKWAAGEGPYRDGRTEWAFVFHALPGMRAEVDGRPLRGRREGDTFVVPVPDDGQAHTLRLRSRAG
jgi:alpha-glucosidase